MYINVYPLQLSSSTLVILHVHVHVHVQMRISPEMFKYINRNYCTSCALIK